ncbi:MAG: DUF4445 domain-containing protein [Tenericutes bacterium]|nr:DUF4445 domain-containing protein [Mycoplasmatota bacterium]
MKVYIKDLARSINSNKGDNLLTLLQDNNIFIQSSCGGLGICKKCQVYDCDAKEYILSCQTTLQKDMSIEIRNQVTEWKSTLDIYDENQIELDDFVGYGIITDIGTTTLAIYLVNLKNGKVIDEFSCLNPQKKYGDDVISRITKIKEFSTKTLQLCVINVISKVIRNFKKTHKITNIDVLYASGNTTMLHIFFGQNPESLGFYPFIPVFLEKKEVAGSDLNLDVSKVILLPSISSFIGADITMGILASNMRKYKNSMLIDLGTNGEMILKKGEKMYGISTAVGPAFEGANIECGSGCIAGAVNEVSFSENKFNIKYMGDKPKTLTGSAVIDVLSIFINQNILSESGLLELKDKRFVYDNQKVYITDKIYVSQKDIREIQLAKSAIRSGIDTLLKVNDLKYEEIDKVFLAGGFGFYMNPENAITIKLLPKEFLNKIEVIGNASAAGAKMCALSKNQLKLADGIGKEVTVIELNKSLIFNDLFIENIGF